MVDKADVSRARFGELSVGDSRRWRPSTDVRAGAKIGDNCIGLISGGSGRIS